MIQTMIELDDRLGKDYFFAALSINNQQMKLQSLNNYCKHLEKTIDLTELDQLQFSQNDVPSLHFMYDEEHYLFIDYGNGVVDYIKQHLPKTLF